PLDAPNIRRQARFDPLPLLIAQPKQVSAHDPNPLPKTNQDRIVRAEKLMSSDPNTLALAARLPTTYPTRGYLEVGGLMSDGPNFPDEFRRAADYVHKILLGAKPGDLPVEQPTRYDLVINLTTAKALGLAIPESFLLRADEVIE